MSLASRPSQAFPRSQVFNSGMRALGRRRTRAPHHLDQGPSPPRPGPLTTQTRAPHHPDQGPSPPRPGPLTTQTRAPQLHLNPNQGHILPRPGRAPQQLSLILYQGP
ncbi:unnamed protein product [Arctogadus glacialis]